MTALRVETRKPLAFVHPLQTDSTPEGIVNGHGLEPCLREVGRLSILTRQRDQRGIADACRSPGIGQSILSETDPCQDLLSCQEW